MSRTNADTSSHCHWHKCAYVQVAGLNCAPSVAWACCRGEPTAEGELCHVAAVYPHRLTQRWRERERDRAMSFRRALGLLLAVGTTLDDLSPRWLDDVSKTQANSTQHQLDNNQQPKPNTKKTQNNNNNTHAGLLPCTETTGGTTIGLDLGGVGGLAIGFGSACDGGGGGGGGSTDFVAVATASAPASTTDSSVSWPAASMPRRRRQSRRASLFCCRESAFQLDIAMLSCWWAM